MRGNTVATIIIGTVIIISVGVFGVRTYQIGETFQSAQQAYTESAIMLEESLQQSISTLMLRGYNNTVGESGNIWWCNVATPPNLTEVNRSLTILAHESVERLIDTLEDAGVSASPPTIHFTFEDSIADLEDDRVVFNISEFIVQLETADGMQSRNLERTYTYAYRTWLILKALDEWAQCDAGELSRELEAALNPTGAQCLYDSCCCGGAGDPADVNWIRNRNQIQGADLDRAVSNAIERLNHILDGGSCTTPGTEDSGITCTAERSLATQLHIQQSHDPGYCTTGFTSNCAIRPIGNPVQLRTSASGYNNICSAAREPITTTPPSVISGIRMSPPANIGTRGSDITGTRFAVDKELTGSITVTCVDERSSVYRDGRFRPLTAIVRLGVAAYQDCQIDADTDPRRRDFRSYVCLEGGAGGGGGGGCVECEGACPENAAQCSEGDILTPICDANGEQIKDSEGNPVCDYRSCEELDCLAPILCCGETLDIPITCIEGQGCVYEQNPQDACEEFIDSLDDPSICEPEEEEGPNGGDEENGGTGEGEEENGGEEEGENGGDEDGDEEEGEQEPETETKPCAEGGAGASACPARACQEAKCVEGNDECQYEPEPDGTSCGTDTFCSYRMCQAGSCRWVANNDRLGQTCTPTGSTGSQCMDYTYTCQMSGDRAMCLEDTSAPKPAGTSCGTPSGDGCRKICDGQGSCVFDESQECSESCGDTVYTGTCSSIGSCITDYDASRCCGTGASAQYCTTTPFACCEGSCEALSSCPGAPQVE